MPIICVQMMPFYRACEEGGIRVIIIAVITGPYHLSGGEAANYLIERNCKVMKEQIKNYDLQKS